MTRRPPSRVGKKPVTAYVSLEEHKRLRRLGVDLDKSTQQIITEALAAYMERYQA